MTNQITGFLSSINTELLDVLDRGGDLSTTIAEKKEDEEKEKEEEIEEIEERSDSEAPSIEAK